jgi:AraC-like DNA-binding protein
MGACFQVHRCGWIEDRFRIRGGEAPVRLHLRSVTHLVGIVVSGQRAVRCITPYRDDEWIERAGAVHLIPADGLQRTIVMRSTTTCDVVHFLIPCRVGCCRCPAVTAEAPLASDPVRQSCLMRLAVSVGEKDDWLNAEAEQASSMLLRRLACAAGCHPGLEATKHASLGVPTIHRLVALIDENLRVAPRLGDVAPLVGLSPSQFAKRLRQSIGLSFHRLVMIRRIRAATMALRNGRLPLAMLALTLGFSSQSHFTMAFRKATGMTPGRYPHLQETPDPREATAAGEALTGGRSRLP